MSESRPGLYLLVGAGMIAALCAAEYAYKNNQILNDLKPQTKIENILGDEAPEKFYEIDNQRVYLEIDGKPIEEYFKQ